MPLETYSPTSEFLVRTRPGNGTRILVRSSSTSAWRKLACAAASDASASSIWGSRVTSGFASPLPSSFHSRRATSASARSVTTRTSACATAARARTTASSKSVGSMRTSTSLASKKPPDSKEAAISTTRPETCGIRSVRVRGSTVPWLRTTSCKS